AGWRCSVGLGQRLHDGLGFASKGRHVVRVAGRTQAGDALADRGEQVCAREFLMRKAQTRRPLEGHLRQPTAAEPAADGFERRRPIAIALMTANAAEMIEQTLPARERRRMAFSGSDREISDERFPRRFRHVEARQGAARKTSMLFICRFY